MTGDAEVGMPLCIVGLALGPAPLAEAKLPVLGWMELLGLPVLIDPEPVEPARFRLK